MAIRETSSWLIDTEFAEFLEDDDDCPESPHREETKETILPHPRRWGFFDVFDKGEFVLIEALIPKALGKAFKAALADAQGGGVDMFDRGNFTLVDARVPRSTFEQLRELYAAYAGRSLR